MKIVVHKKHKLVNCGLKKKVNQRSKTKVFGKLTDKAESLQDFQTKKTSHDRRVIVLTKLKRF